MAKRKVEWSPEGILSFNEIIKYYNELNGNKKYSSLLAKDVDKSIKYIKNNNYIGKETDIENVRVLYHKYYGIFYEVKENLIQIQLIWDTRRDPDKLKI